jgi:hypothetical protein
VIRLFVCDATPHHQPDGGGRAVSIVVNNGILIIECAREAVSAARRPAGDVRLPRALPPDLDLDRDRAAMVPLARDGRGAEMRPMAIVSINGLVVSTLLSLFVIPAIYLGRGVARALPGPGRLGGIPAPGARHGNGPAQARAVPATPIPPPVMKSVAGRPRRRRAAEARAERWAGWQRGDADRA